MSLKSDYKENAPGSPGKPARWSSSAKSGIGKALLATSDVSFTLSHGILTEVYYPWEDEACIKDMEFLVTSGNHFFSEEKKGTLHAIKSVSPGVPAYVITNICKEKKYSIHKEIISDPIRNTILQRVRFKALKGTLTDFRLFVLLAPHLGNQGSGNTGWVGEYKGVPMLFAKYDNRALALACSSPWVKRSAGFAGISDGWQDVFQHKQMEWEYERAGNGNIALAAQIDLAKTAGRFILSLGFGHNEYEAAYSARGSLLAGYQDTRKQYVNGWRNWQRKLTNSKSHRGGTGKLFRISASILRMHEANRVPGAIIASMSIPWGETKGDEDTGGYHMVWPRDLVESSGGLLALNAKEDTLRILTYLMTTQEEDGHWMQNMYLQGKPHWTGIQMDQTALPVLLVDLFREHGILKPDKMHRYWIMVKKALGYLVQHGPETEQDRWERDGGLSIFTVASEIAALVAGADFAMRSDEPEIAGYLLETADYWNDQIEEWFYVTGTALAEKCEVDGYYIRINNKGVFAKDLKGKKMHVHNHSPQESQVRADEMVSPDALALVRFGLRAPDDPKIKNTIKVIDETLMVKTPYGPCWHRYSHDGFGEHEDGSPYNGTGVGRGWPLLTGERAHYEIAAGNTDGAAALIKTMEAFSTNGFIPEQIWDSNDIPEKDLYTGRHTGSAMPLVWAHAEYIKLSRSLKQGKVFDMPIHTVKRYVEKKTNSSIEIWRAGHPVPEIENNKILRIETKESIIVHWSADGWETTLENLSKNSGLGLYFTDIPVQDHDIVFTFRNSNTGEWIRKDFEVKVRHLTK